MQKSPAVAETADRTAYDASINDHPDNNTLQSSQQHKQNNHVIKKAKVFFLILGVESLSRV